MALNYTKKANCAHVVQRQRAGRQMKRVTKQEYALTPNAPLVGVHCFKPDVNVLTAIKIWAHV